MINLGGAEMWQKRCSDQGDKTTKGCLDCCQAQIYQNSKCEVWVHMSLFFHKNISNMHGPSFVDKKHKEHYNAK